MAVTDHRSVLRGDDRVTAMKRRPLAPVNAATELDDDVGARKNRCTEKFEKTQVMEFPPRKEDPFL